MTPRDAQRPFMVVAYDSASLIAEQPSEDHDEACAYAVEQLRLATAGSSAT